MSYKQYQACNIDCNGH